MSSTPLILLSIFRWSVKFMIGKGVKIVDSMYYDGLTDPFYLKPMGESDHVRRKQRIRRRIPRH